MGKPNFSDEFKRDAVAQITERAYARCHCSHQRICTWKRRFAACFEHYRNGFGQRA